MVWRGAASLCGSASSSAGLRADVRIERRAAPYQGALALYLANTFWLRKRTLAALFALAVASRFCARVCHCALVRGLISDNC